MAKGASSKSGSSRIRFVMLEADIADGDLAQITHAIQNALRPAQAAQQPRLISAGSSANSHEDEGMDDPDLGGGDFIEVEAPAPKRRSSKPRVAKTPTVLNDIDFKSEPALEDFAAEFDIKTDVDRYLCVALWFREARAVDGVTVDHIYTAFRLLGWPTSSRDFSKPLRNLRDEQALTGGTKDGFTLTLIGAGKIEKKKKS